MLIPKHSPNLPNDQKIETALERSGQPMEKQGLLAPHKLKFFAFRTAEAYLQTTGLENGSLAYATSHQATIGGVSSERELGINELPDRDSNRQSNYRSLCEITYLCIGLHGTSLITKWPFIWDQIGHQIIPVLRQAHLRFTTLSHEQHAIGFKDLRDPPLSTMEIGKIRGSQSWSIECWPVQWWVCVVYA